MHVIWLNFFIVGDKKEARKTGEIGTDDCLFTFLIICLCSECVC